MRSAAIAFYTLFSLAPMLVVAVAISGAVFGEQETRERLEAQVEDLAGEESASLVRRMLDSAARPNLSRLAGIVGLVTLLFGATTVFGQLQESLNAVWEVRPQPGNAIRGFLKKRLLSLGLVLVIGFLLLVSLVLSAAVSALGEYFQSRLPVPEELLGALDFGISLLVISVLFGLIFQFLPDAELSWRNVAVGAVVTALLFSIGKELIGLYLGRAGVASAYGVAGSVVLTLLWVYYSSMILLFGACFTRVWSRRQRPAGVVPERGAERCPNERRGRPRRDEERGARSRDRDGRARADAGGRGAISPASRRAPRDAAGPA
jgi:membrane protein